MMRGWSVLVSGVQLVLWIHMQGDADATSCVQKGDLDFRPHPTNCALFHRCVGTQLYTFTCGDNTVYSPEEIDCVHKGSPEDTCQKDVNPICKKTTDTLIPHRTRCSLYHNCSAPARRSYWENNLQECDHPRVYNSDTLRCEHFSMVECGEREMPLGPCEYKVSECRTSHCRPCYIDNPSCRSLSDGLHADPNRKPSPFFIVCVDQRLVHKDRCLSIDGRDVIQICNTTTNALIPHDTRCSLYYNCSAPAQFLDWEKYLQECAYPQVYNPCTRRCEHISMIDCDERQMPRGPYLRRSLPMRSSRCDR